MPEVILDAYRNDLAEFCEYCLEDARLVSGILEHEGLVELTLRRSMLTGLSLDNAWGSVAAFEFLYISELHKRGMVAPDSGVDRTEQKGAPGGLVMEPKTGLYRNVYVFDFKSLYPSIIRTFNIDPLSRILASAADKNDVLTAPNGASFSKSETILPGMLDTFFERRDRAKKDGDALASYTYKILMNSFYGVLGTPACRFSSGYLAGAITEFGHYILRWVRDWFEEKGLTVLYGDTDSLFVLSAADADEEKLIQKGKHFCGTVNTELASHVHETYGVRSRLELEFEKLYERFLLPSVRGRPEQGRAKGYAGLKDGELEIVGMEAVRRDWTVLAHELQRNLINLLFADAEPVQLEDCVSDCISSLKQGKEDEKLVYHKNLRKPVSSYTATTPPHVKAAMLLPAPKGVIHYVMTLEGPQPLGYVTAPLDYAHYIKKQIDPIARIIAQVCPFDIETAVTGEKGLFSG
jgi:DNA polymerase-2